jgi:hypothetical protein
LARLHSICDLLIDPAGPLGALVGFEQDASVSELAGRGAASCDQALELFSLGFAQDNGIFLLHNERSIPTASMIKSSVTEH